MKRPPWLTSLAIILLLCCLLPTPVRATLELNEVESSVSNQYPPLLIARIERDIASGKLLAAWGKFDPKLSAFASFGIEGFYDGNLFGVKVEGRDPNGRTRFYSGYRYSEGAFPDYEKGRTSAGGQFVLGVEVPLMRDGEIDSERLQRQIAQLDLQGVEPLIAFQRIELIAKARKAYVNWVAAGFELHYNQTLLDLALTRNNFLDRMIEEGQMAEVVALDNERIIVKRRLSLSKALEKVRASAIELSLFYRDAKGNSIIPDPSQLPEDFPDVSLYLGSQYTDASLVREAYVRRPELRANSIEMRQNFIALRGAENMFKPRLDLRIESAVNAGNERTKDRGPNDLRAGIEFSMPLWRREAKGKILAINAKTRQLQAKRQFLMDKLKASVLRSHNDHFRAKEQLGLASRSVDLSEQIRLAEDKRFRSGAGDLLDLQIREQQFFEAELAEVDAHAMLLKSWIEIEAALGKPYARPVVVK